LSCQRLWFLYLRVLMIEGFHYSFSWNQKLIDLGDVECCRICLQILLYLLHLPEAENTCVSSIAFMSTTGHNDSSTKGYFLLITYLDSMDNLLHNSANTFTLSFLRASSCSRACLYFVLINILSRPSGSLLSS
jgi:hypothetical protein